MLWKLQALSNGLLLFLIYLSIENATLGMLLDSRVTEVQTDVKYKLELTAILVFAWWQTLQREGIQ